jgi:hypothetical protein
MTPSLNAFERAIARISGPMSIRFIFQPAMAIVLGVRDGLHDAREGHTPFLWDLYTHPGDRRARMWKAFDRLALPLGIAIVLDAVVQYMLFERIHMLGAILVGTVVLGVPYSLAREATNRIVSVAPQFVPRNLSGPGRRVLAWLQALASPRLWSALRWPVRPGRTIRRSPASGSSRDRWRTPARPPNPTRSTLR